MVNTNDKPKKNLGESIRQRLKNLSEDRERPFDEILRYYPRNGDWGEQKSTRF